MLKAKALKPVVNHSSQNFSYRSVMEIGAYEIVKEVMREIAVRCKITWKIYRNVKVTTKNGFLKKYVSNLEHDTLRKKIFAMITNDL